LQAIKKNVKPQLLALAQPQVNTEPSRKGINWYKKR